MLAGTPAQGPRLAPLSRCPANGPLAWPRPPRPLLQLRHRAEELRRSIDRIIHTLQFAADRVQW